MKSQSNSCIRLVDLVKILLNADIFADEHCGDTPLPHLLCFRLQVSFKTPIFHILVREDFKWKCNLSILSNTRTQHGHFEASSPICSESITVQWRYFRRQLLQLQGIFAGSREQPGEIHFSTVRAFWIDRLELDLLPSRLWWKPMVCSMLHWPVNGMEWCQTVPSFEITLAWSSLGTMGYYLRHFVIVRSNTSSNTLLCCGKISGGFSGGPVVKTLHSQCRVPGFHPWSGN